MRKGFTLIELLIVIAIIGILSAIIFPNYMASREKARDTTRKNDLSQIQKSLELYRMDQANSSFPETGELPIGSPWASATTTYMNLVPNDPLASQDDTRSYFYTRPSPLSYTLCACLENNAEPVGGNIVLCADYSIECEDTCGTSSNTKCYYIIYE